MLLGVWTGHNTLCIWAGIEPKARYMYNFKLLYPAWLAFQPCRCSHAVQTLRQVFLFNLHSRMLAGPFYADRYRACSFRPRSGAQGRVKQHISFPSAGRVNLTSGRECHVPLRI